MKKQISHPDETNESLEYWETVLASHGLGVDQPLTDNSDDDASVEPPHIPRNSSLSTRQNDFRYLSQQLDVHDGFMTGHEIKKAKGAQENRVPPGWALDDEKIKQILLRSFPKMQTNEAQRKKAGRWLRAIHLYYRMGLLRPVVIKELKISFTAWKALIRSIRRAAQGVRADGSGARRHAPTYPLIDGTIGREK